MPEVAAKVNTEFFARHTIESAAKWVQHKLSGADIAVLTVIETLSFSNGSCFPSNEYLSRATTLALRTVERCVQKLVSAGLIVRSLSTSRRPSGRVVASRTMAPVATKVVVPPDRCDGDRPTDVTDDRPTKVAGMSRGIREKEKGQEKTKQPPNPQADPVYQLFGPAEATAPPRENPIQQKPKAVYSARLLEAARDLQRRREEYARET